jgi:translation elongation factor EF-Tu-like GTPase
MPAESALARTLDREPDCLAEMTFLATEAGGRAGAAASGYRPAHLVVPGYLTTGVHEYVDRQCVSPGESAAVRIWFITPEVYPHCLWPGRVIAVQEASWVVGSARVTAVLNPLLRGTPE